MRKKDFDNLVTSIRQAGRIRRGEIKPSRVIQFAPPDIRAIRLSSANRKRNWLSDGLLENDVTLSTIDW